MNVCEIKGAGKSFLDLPSCSVRKILSKAFSETHDPASLALVNKEFRSIIRECREAYLEKVPLIKFMKHSFVSMIFIISKKTLGKD